ncbi:MAG: CBS domain-containing protein [Wenzhouxiangellaceae bacterium]|nr:CBS domain-containing protein [Wenzhouxiangellaceae bacterium]MBS3822436.1 CBS domain-containing protein [Wenzhouxiangellaceae bacterium]
MTRPSPDITRFLQTVAPFSRLDSASVEALAARLKVRYHTKGDALGEFSPPGGDGLFIIRKGAVELLDPDGEILEQRGEGDLFGHRIAFGGEHDDYSARAIEDCLIWQLEARDLSAMLERHPPLAAFFEAGPGARLREESQIRARRETLGELGLRKPVTAGPEASIAACARAMAESQVSCLPLVEHGELVGIITDRDLRNRVLARGLDPERPVRDIMTADPATVALGGRIEAALVEMMRLGIHHLPVTDADGALAAVVSAGDLVRVQSPHPLRLVRDIQRADTGASVAKFARRGPRMLAGLANAGAGASEIGRIAGRITDACTRRLLALAEDELGEAPLKYAWLAFGSQARLEQGLISDQDNGLLLAEEPDDAAAEYFEALATRVCDGLNECGYVFCPGGVMAKGEWRMSFRGWRKRFDRWIREPAPKSVMQSSIFFDLRAVAGDGDLAGRLHREVLQQAHDSEIFRRFLASESLGRKPPVGLFRQFVQEHGGEQSRGLNLKRRGVIPIVDLARVRALEGALEVIHTEERIEAAAGAGLMTESDGDDLIHALKFIADIRLAHQARQLEAGHAPDHLVDPDELSGLHRRYLRSAFRIVSEAQKALALRYLL